MPRDAPKRTFVAGFIIGLLACGVLIALSIVIVIRIPVALNPSPIAYVEPKAVSNSTLCAGDDLVVKSTVHFNEPAVVDTFVSMRSIDSGRNIPGTQERMPTRVQPRMIDFADTYTVTIPYMLAPGHYEYVRATIAVNMDAQPAFLTVPFTVEVCDRR